ncbi:hypothetical protein ABZ892_16205 [Streptomyces sp. NPDC046924]|uniref:hypothetical protein n=1 Tax=Streptomyces sp. NPDC046924 TaxID=3155136 RepID=UPI0033C6BED7
METTQIQALIGMFAVLGLFVLMVLPAVIGIARDRRIDRQLKQAETDSAAAERRPAPAGQTTAGHTAPQRSHARGTTSHRTARAA